MRMQTNTKHKCDLTTERETEYTEGMQKQILGDGNREIREIREKKADAKGMKSRMQM